MTFATNDLSDTLLDSARLLSLEAGYTNIANHLAALIKTSNGSSMDDAAFGGKANLLGLQQTLAEDRNPVAQTAMRCIAHARIVIKSLSK